MRSATPSTRIRIRVNVAVGYAVGYVRRTPDGIDAKVHRALREITPG